MRACLFLLTAYAAFAQCEPSELRTQLEALPDMNTDRFTFREVMEANRALVAQHPGSIPAEQQLIFNIYSGWWAEDDRRKEIARYRAMPDRQLGEFLEAALRLSRYDPRQLSARFPELAKQICNSPIVPIGKLRNEATRAEAIPVALNALGDRTDGAAAIGWWEVIAAMNKEHDARLPDAIRTLRAMDRYELDIWVSETLQAFELVKDKEGAAELRAELAERRPDSYSAITAAIEKWHAEHPPKSTTEAGLAESTRDAIHFLWQLRQQHPHSIPAAINYLLATHYGSLPALSTDEALAAADFAAQCDRDYPSSSIFRSDAIPLQMARVYLDRNVRVDQVPHLAAEQLRRARVEYDLVRAFPGYVERANNSLQQTAVRANSLLAEYAIQRKDVAEARRYIELARSSLAMLAPGLDASENDRKLFEYYQAPWLKAVKLVGMDATPLTEPRVVDWSKVARAPFPDFSVTDLEGRHWDLTAWKGKVVFVNLWGTWCVPCRAELPHIQKLYDDSKDGVERLVITVNVDEDEELTRKFMRENGYTFPVIHSEAFADLIDHTGGYPQSRVIDPQGRMLQEPLDIHCPSCTESVRRLMDGLAAKEQR